MHKQATVLAGWAGIGKTELAKRYPQQVLDLESSAYKWVGGGSEEQKGLPGRVLQPDYPLNYFEALEAAMPHYAFICVALHADIQAEMDKRGIPYTYVLAHPNDQQHYEERYRDRGNSPLFYANLPAMWQSMVTLGETYPDQTVWLESNSTLEAYLRARGDL